MSSSSVSFSTVSPSDRFTGRVKWFNNKAGYGFVTITDGANSGKDLFVHHSAIRVDSEQYKYLVQGEYVEFSLSDTGGVGNHEYQASDVTGIKGGKLMCETRNEQRSAKIQHRSEPEVQATGSQGRGSQGRGAQGRGRGRGRGTQGRGRGSQES